MSLLLFMRANFGLLFFFLFIWIDAFSRHWFTFFYILCVILGIARGCGWQKIGAFVNLGSYYIVGIPSALLFAFVLHVGGKVSHYFSAFWEVFFFHNLDLFNMAVHWSGSLVWHLMCSLRSSHISFSHHFLHKLGARSKWFPW